MRILLVALLLIACGSASAAKRMVECENCTTNAQLAAKAAGAASIGEIYVFSLKNNLIAKFNVEYDAEIRKFLAFNAVVESAAVDGFIHLKNAYEYNPNDFYGRSHYSAPIGTIRPGNSYDPVALSIRGNHQGSYGTFVADFKACMSTAVCLNQISPQLFSLTQADWTFKQVEINLFAVVAGATVAWERVPPAIVNALEVRLCLSGDCAQLKFENGQWVYKGTFAENGDGARYPFYMETLVYEAETGTRNIQYGLDRVGVQINGYLKQNFVFRCAYVNQRLDDCYWIPRVQNP